MNRNINLLKKLLLGKFIYYLLYNSYIKAGLICWFIFIYCRLKANNLIRKNNIDKYNRKTENLDNKLKDEYEHAKTMLDEKFLLKKKLNAEVEELQRVIKLIVFKFKILLSKPLQIVQYRNYMLWMK